MGLYSPEQEIFRERLAGKHPSPGKFRPALGPSRFFL
jgi:hypothetical protein